MLSPLSWGTELAIGGGNPLSHPNLPRFLEALQNRGIVANITVNQGHLLPYRESIQGLIRGGLIKGLGVSVVSPHLDPIRPLLLESNNIVYHVIAGVNSPIILDYLETLGSPKVLVLGYKTFGRGVDFLNPGVPSKITEWYRAIRRKWGQMHLSFDNLAIEQLRIQRLFTEDEWDQFYMGDDGQFTMYIDAVEQTFARTSRSQHRVPFNQTSLRDFFQSLRKPTSPTK